MEDVSLKRGRPLVLSGDAFARGAAQSADDVDPAQIRAATIGRVAKARAEGLIDADAEAYLRAQRAFATEHDPHSMAEVAGIASGFDLPFDELFAHLHLGTLRDLKTGGTLAQDGCSAWAVSDSAEGPLVVKSRDFSGTHLGVQRVFSHEGPDLFCGALLCVGSLGSPGAYSSGMNAKGLALVDTQVSVVTHRVGWLRYFLMTRILANCATVDDALRFIRAVPHAGGGTLVLADAEGKTAAVELGARQVVVTSDQVVWRTNHFVTPDLAAETLMDRNDKIAANSHARFDYLARELSDRLWTASDAADLMGRHQSDGPQSAPLCQHVEHTHAQTISSVVYSCRLGRLIFSETNPCAKQWLQYDLPM